MKRNMINDHDTAVDHTYSLVTIDLQDESHTGYCSDPEYDTHEERFVVIEDRLRPRLPLFMPTELVNLIVEYWCEQVVDLDYSWQNCCFFNNFRRVIKRQHLRSEHAKMMISRKRRAFPTHMRLDVEHANDFTAFHLVHFQPFSVSANFT
jgi:hypothetical protein